MGLMKQKLEEFDELVSSFEVAEIKGDKEQMKFYSNEIKRFQLEMGLADEEIEDMINEFHNVVYANIKE